MTDAWEKFKKFVKKNGLVCAGDRVLLAVSGGPDSMCMMHLFWRLKKTLPIKLFSVYLDHGLREKTKDEIKTIKKESERMNVTFLTGRISVKSYAKSEKVSLETAGRILRYKTFMRLARELGCNKISTGHTANDNAETLLMWLIRGTGSEGLSGIPVSRLENDKITVIRPVLSVTRPEIMGYLKRQKMPFCIDKTNYSLDFTRNRIRHELIPSLEKYNPSVVEHLNNSSQIISRENEFINRFTTRALRKSCVILKNKITLDLKQFIGYNEVIQARILKNIIPQKRSLAWVERLTEWILRSPQKEIHFSRLWRLEKNKNKLIFFKL